jgi:glycosyltransferase involved in cell wall biosynthesis
MKILLLQDAEWRKKGPHHQHHLMELLSLRGHEIRVIGFDQLWRDENGDIISRKVVAHDINRFYKGAKVTFIRPFFLRIPIFDYISYLFSSRIEVKEQILIFKPDVIIGFSSILSNFWGVIYANKEQIPYIYYWVDIVHKLSVPKPFGPIAIFLEKIIIKKSTSIIVINEALKDPMVKLGGVRDSIQIIPGGINFERFNSEVDGRSIREQYGIFEDDILLIFIGWIYNFGGLKEVIQELPKYKSSKNNIKLMIVGEGDYYFQLKEFVRINGLSNSVMLIGRKPYNELPQLIAASDFCILPAQNNEIMKDIVPIKMYEYLAMNKPVISTKLPGILKEFGYNNGVIYIDKPSDLIQKVNSLTFEEIDLNRQRAKAFIKNYDWNIIASNFEKLLISLKDKNIN